MVGPVKKVEAYLIEFVRRDNGVVEAKRRPLSTTTYNTEGNISEKITYDPSGAIIVKVVHTYLRGRSIFFLWDVSLLEIFCARINQWPAIVL